MSHYSGSVPETKRKTDWRDQAACRGIDTDDWFPNPTNITDVQAAKQACFGCPVMVQCAQFALRTHQKTGIWGGLAESQRNTLHKRYCTSQFDDLHTVREAVLHALRDELKSKSRLHDLWNERTYRLPGGHIGWKSESNSFSIHGHVFTPKQFSFFLDRGHKAVGIVRRTSGCPVVECVDPRHLADSEERHRRKQAEEGAAVQAAARAQYAADEFAS